MPKLLEKEQDLWNILSSFLFIFLAAWISYVLYRRQIQIEDIPVSHLVILALAAFRLIRLFTYDSVMSFLRDYFGKFKYGPGLTLGNILDCPWCTGVWAALAIAVIYFFIPGGIYFLTILALAGVGSYLQIIIWKIGSESKDRN